MALNRPQYLSGSMSQLGQTRTSGRGPSQIRSSLRSGHAATAAACRFGAKRRHRVHSSRTHFQPLRRTSQTVRAASWPQWQEHRLPRAVHMTAIAGDPLKNLTGQFFSKCELRNTPHRISCAFGCLCAVAVSTAVALDWQRQPEQQIKPLFVASPLSRFPQQTPPRYAPIALRASDTPRGCKGRTAPRRHNHN